MQYDVAVVGLGVMGSACAYALAKHGVRVVAFDRLEPPHHMGSTHGHTRIIREAYYEHPLYVPLVRRSYELWGELARESGAQLMVTTGGLMVGPEKGPLVRGALESARTHHIAHEMLDAKALVKRFPAYHPRADWVGLLEQRAGMLFPETCVTAFQKQARQHGATLRTNEVVLSWKASGKGVSIATIAGTVEAERLIAACGPWLPGLLPHIGISLPLEIERQMSHWFEPETPSDKYKATHCPVGLWEMPDRDVFATLPDEGHGVKCGMHHAGAPTSPESVNRIVSHGENAVARELLETVMPGAGGRLLAARVCLYTNTPDRNFIVDWAPGNKVLVVSPCSGHGFKFAPAIGEVAAQMVRGEKVGIDLSPFSLSRFG